MEKILLEELLRTDRSDMASRYQGAAIIMEECGDSEIAHTLKIIAAQIVFDDSDNSVASEVVNRTKDKLDKMIAERKEHHADQYIQFIRDDEILAVSGGEVMQDPYSELDSSYLKGGLFDPDIFGGSGKIQRIHSNEELDFKAFGKGIGHISLPCRVILKKSYRVVANLLGMTVKNVESVAKYTRHIVIKGDEKTFKTGQILTEKEYLSMAKNDGIQVGIGADALYEMLVNLNYADHPERLAFKVVPVIAPVFRPMAYLEDEHKFFMDCISKAYSRIVFAVRRFNTVSNLQAPDIIVQDTKRRIAEIVDDFDDIIQKHYYTEVDHAKSRKPNISYLSHLSLAMRKRRIGYLFSRDEKTSEIESLGLYPKEIRKMNEDGTSEVVTLKEIVDSCHDTMFEYEQSHAIILKGEEPDEEEQAESDQVQEHIDRMDAVLDDILKGSMEKREDFAVRFSKELNMYEAAG